MSQPENKKDWSKRAVEIFQEEMDKAWKEQESQNQSKEVSQPENKKDWSKRASQIYKEELEKSIQEREQRESNLEQLAKKWDNLTQEQRKEVLEKVAEELAWKKIHPQKENQKQSKEVEEQEQKIKMSPEQKKRWDEIGERLMKEQKQTNEPIQEPQKTINMKTNFYQKVIVILYILSLVLIAAFFVPFKYHGYHSLWYSYSILFSNLYAEIIIASLIFFALFLFYSKKDEPDINSKMFKKKIITEIDFI